MNSTARISKPHYLILDGLRGLASVIVIIFHSVDNIFHHGYLAVDFFFMLSGFVMGYAYDDRWGGGMTIAGFLKRRFIRLQPMVVMGTIIGAITFYMGASQSSPLIEGTPWWQMLLIMLAGLLMVPVTPSMDIRGWREMYPLNSPAWSLFYEYVANILYALFIRRFSKKMLALSIFLCAGVLLYYGITARNGTVSGGNGVTLPQLKVGLTRLMYPFLAGLLLCRAVKIIPVKYAFLWSALLLILVLAVPVLGTGEHKWMNSLYDSLVIIVIFPMIIYLGTGGTLHNKMSVKICRFFADISYPLYITHFPLVAVYSAYMQNNKYTLKEAWPATVLFFVMSISLAYACSKLYDEPVRKWLNKKFA